MLEGESLMRWYEAAGIGMVMAALYSLILWASVDSLSQASFILYGDTFKLPLEVTGVIIIIAFICLFSYPLWAGKLEQMIVYTITKKKDDDDE
jgi:hypothetical protein